MRIVVIMVVVCLLSGCMTERKRADVFHRYAREHPTELAELCADEFPPKITTVKGKTDTVTKRDTLRVRVPVKIPGGTDTVWADCPPAERIYHYINRTDTIMQENTAMIESLRLRRDSALQDLGIYRAMLEEWRERAKNRVWWIVGLAIALGVSVIFRLRKLIGF